MHRTDPSTGKECGGSVPGHRKVDGDGVALLDAEGLEDIRDAADLAEQLAVRDKITFAWFIGFVDDGSLVRVLERPTVDTVVGSVQTTFREPDDVSVLEISGANGVEWSIPMQCFSCDLKLKFVSIEVQWNGGSLGREKDTGRAVRMRRVSLGMLCRSLTSRTEPGGQRLNAEQPRVLR